MKHLITTLLACAAIYSSSAQDALTMSPDAKVMGMGGVSMTTLSGAYAIYNNSASAIFSPSPVHISTSYYSQNEYNAYAVSGAIRFQNKNLVQVGWRQYRRLLGNNDIALDLGYSRRFGEHWAVGVVARYSRLKIDDQSHHALAVDLSAMYSLPLENIGQSTTFRAGAKLSNLGGYWDSDYRLPMNITAGAALDTFVTDAHEITIGADLGYCYTPKDIRGIHASLGVEYNLMQLFQLRGGYHYNENSLYNPCYASVGAGIRFLFLRLDFAYLFAKKDTYLRNSYYLSAGVAF